MGKKMSKSLGNFFTLSQLQEKGYSPMHLKYFFYSANFRKIQNFTFEGLDFAKVSYDKLKVTLQKLDKPNSLIEVTNDKYFLLFKAAVEDSFNIPVAVSIVWNVVNSNYSSELKYSLIDRFDQVLGLKLLSE
jgi:cysteinyl-tRNA synthetase